MTIYDDVFRANTSQRKRTHGIKAESIKRRFINGVYGGNFTAYRRARKADYCKVQFEWACFIDYLCKDGQITQRVYDSITF